LARCGAREGLALALAISLSLAIISCTPNAGGAPSVNPTIAPSPVPTLESPQERQVRRDYEAAETAYRAVTAEVDRLAAAGGTEAATARMRETATDEYLTFQLESLQYAKEKGWRTQKPTRIVGVGRRGWSSREIGLTACEDNSEVRIIDRRGRDVTPDSVRRYVQTLTVKKVDSRWKVSMATTQQVPNFKSRDCGT
jgi:hypothetical protein